MKYKLAWYVVCLFSWRYNSLWLYFHSPVAGFLASSFSRFLEHTQRLATVGRTPLNEWSIRRRDLYLTTHNTHNRQTSMPPVVFEPTISAGEQPKNHALDRAATGTGSVVCSRHTKFQPENLTGRDCLRNPGVGGIMILKLTLKNETVTV